MKGYSTTCMACFPVLHVLFRKSDDMKKKMSGREIKAIF